MRPAGRITLQKARAKQRLERKFVVRDKIPKASESVYRRCSSSENSAKLLARSTRGSFTTVVSRNSIL
jgi:hypothetical protein